MGYVSLHLEKAAGNDAQMSAHIERTIEPANADKSRTHLNRELIEFPDGVKNRTEVKSPKRKTQILKTKSIFLTNETIKTKSENFKKTHAKNRFQIFLNSVQKT